MKRPIRAFFIAFFNASALALVQPLAVVPDAAAAEVQVLHWWTAGGEASALKELERTLRAQGVQWRDVPIAGGGGAQAMTTLRARVLSADPPTAAQMLGFDIRDWAAQGALQDLTPLARSGGWAQRVPKALQAFDTDRGRWVAAPIDVHSSNWVWANKAVLERAGVHRAPGDWGAFISDLDKVRKAGFVPLAAGGQPWQIATMFDGIVLSVGGPAFYRRALIELQPAALDSAAMRTSFTRLRALRSYVDGEYANRDWNVATGMVIDGRAGFQMMGDWALGEFNHAGRVPGKDYLCLRTPGTQGSVTFNSDAFVFFDVKDRAAQARMVDDVMSPEVQARFNRVKGSAPALLGVSPAGFNACGAKAIADLAEADRAGTLMGSMSQGYAVPPAIQHAFYDIIARAFDGEITPAQAAAQLAAAARARY